MCIRDSSNPLQIGLVSDKYWFKMYEDGTDAHLYAINSDTPRVDVSESDLQEKEKMKNLTKAMHKTVQYMLHHNKRENLKGTERAL